MKFFLLFLLPLLGVTPQQIPIRQDQYADGSRLIENIQRAAESWTDRLVNFPGQLFSGELFSNTSGGGGPPVKGCPRPPNFPVGIDLKQDDFINWSEQLILPAFWTAQPELPEDVVTLANWAYMHGYTLRARGHMHSWAPMTVTSTTSCSRVLLVDTTKHLTQMRINAINESDSYAPMSVNVQTGQNWEELLAYLESKGYGVFSFPAVGRMTLGGTLAIGAHGTGFPTKQTKISTGFRSGSISNLITKLDAVVWSHDSNAYVLRTFDRLHDADSRVFLVHLGRAFLTSVTLRIDNNYNLRCQSITNIRADQLFSRDHDNDKALSNFVENYDRVEAQLFPFTDKTWLKLWTEEKTKQGSWLTITAPYPYNHGRQVYRPVDRLIALLVSGITRLTPVISRMTYELGVSGVALTRTADVWGPSKNSLLYYHHLAHKFISLGYTVITSRPNIQKVVNLCYLAYTRLSEDMSKEGKFPMNQPLEFRITGLDREEIVEGKVVKPPSLSFLTEVEGHPEYDVAIFLGLHYFPGTPNTGEYMKEWETFLFNTFNGAYGTARVEWAKTWGFDEKEPWVNGTVYNEILPGTFGSEWNWAMSTLDHYDPHNIYSNEFLQRITLPL